MMLNIVKVTLASAFLVVSAVAGLAQTNPGLAKGMAGALAGGGGVTETENGTRGTASTISGGGNGGWGNLGSQLTGGQVSNRDGNRGSTDLAD